MHSSVERMRSRPTYSIASSAVASRPDSRPGAAVIITLGRVIQGRMACKIREVEMKRFGCMIAPPALLLCPASADTARQAWSGKACWCRSCFPMETW